LLLPPAVLLDRRSPPRALAPHTFLESLQVESAEARSNLPVSPSVGRFVITNILAAHPDYDAGALALSEEQQAADRAKWATENVIRRFVPVSGTRATPVVQISCGFYHTLMVTESREVLALGSGEYGQLGLGDDRTRDAPCTPAGSSSPSRRHAATQPISPCSLHGSRTGAAIQAPTVAFARRVIWRRSLSLG